MAELRETYEHRVNRKVVERLHRLRDPPLRRMVTPPKAEIGPLEVFYTDFTELRSDVHNDHFPGLTAPSQQSASRGSGWDADDIRSTWFHNLTDN